MCLGLEISNFPDVHGLSVANIAEIDSIIKGKAFIQHGDQQGIKESNHLAHTSVAH